MNLNTFIIVGYLHHLGERRSIPGRGTTTTTVYIKTERRFKNGEQWQTQESVIPVEVFGRNADFALDHLSPGDSVCAEGRAQCDTIQKREGGGSWEKLKLVADKLSGDARTTEHAPANEGYQQPPRRQAPQPQTTSRQERSPGEEIPF